MRLLRILGSVAVTLGLAAFVVFALSLRQATPEAVTGATNPESPAAEPSVLATPGTKLECGTSMVSRDAPEPTIANRAAVASAVVIATVVEVSPPRWNTDDGAAPEAARPPAGAHIYTPVTITVDDAVKGLETEELTVRVPGGTVGCYSFVFDNTPDLKAGAQYAFFLAPGVDAAGNSEAAELTVNEAWPVVDGATVVTPLDGERSLPAFSTLISNVVP